MKSKSFISHVRAVGDTEACWEWTGPVGTTGYGRYGRSHYAHRVAYERMVQPIPEGMFVLHHCDNKLCCRPSHLYVGTHQENMRDARERRRTAYGLHPENIRRGADTTAQKYPERQVRGTRHPLAKLSEADVVSIIFLHGTTSTSALARRFGVSRTTIQRIVAGRQWRHITGASV